jgi:hypothetical protein
VSRLSPAPVLHILDPDAAQEHARNRQTWSDLWRAIASEVDADRTDEPRDDEEAPAETAA